MNADAASLRLFHLPLLLTMVSPKLQPADADHLRLLTIFHYVVAGITGLFSCMFLMHVFIGLAFILSPTSLVGNAGEVPPPFFGWMFLIMGSIAFLSGWTIAVCLLFAARFIQRRTHHLFCVIVAGFSCLSFPFGTVLGIFTLIVLLRPQVKEAFLRVPKR